MRASIAKSAFCKFFQRIRFACVPKRSFLRDSERHAECPFDVTVSTACVESKPWWREEFWNPVATGKQECRIFGDVFQLFLCQFQLFLCQTRKILTLRGLTLRWKVKTRVVESAPYFTVTVILFLIFDIPWNPTWLWGLVSSLMPWCSFLWGLFTLLTWNKEEKPRSHNASDQDQKWYNLFHTFIHRWNKLPKKTWKKVGTEREPFMSHCHSIDWEFGRRNNQTKQ